MAITWYTPPTKPPSRADNMGVMFRKKHIALCVNFPVDMRPFCRVGMEGEDRVHIMFMDDKTEGAIQVRDKGRGINIQPVAWILKNRLSFAEVVSVEVTSPQSVAITVTRKSKDENTNFGGGM